MRLNIDTHDDTCVYSNGDVVEGHVELAFDKDTTVDGFNIKLFGRASVRLKDSALNSDPRRHIHGDRTFLRISAPIKSSALPPNGIARGGHTYVLPFCFTVPDTLLPYACNCDAEQDGASVDTHLHLPPSFGRPKSSASIRSSSGSKNAQVVYTVEVDFRRQFPDGSSIMISKGKEICVVPSGDRTQLLKTEVDSLFEEDIAGKKAMAQPPVGNNFASRVDKVEAQIPQALHLELPCAKDTPTMSIPVQLRSQSFRFDGAPPVVEDVTVKMLSVTSWGFPSNEESCMPGGCNVLRREHKTQVRLDVIDLKGLVWMRLPSSPVDPLHCQDNENPPTYSTTFCIPTQLSQATNAESNKLFAPTFSSCSISQRYSIELKFSYRPACTTTDESTVRSSFVQSVQRRLARRSHLTVKAPLRIYYRRRTLAEKPAKVVDGFPDCLESKVDPILLLEDWPPAYTPIGR